MQYLTLALMGLVNILAIGLFFFYIFKRKISIATYVEKVNFYSNLILLLVTLNYLNLITPYLSESLLFHSLAFSPAKIIPNLGALFFWTLIIYVVKIVLLRRADSIVSNPTSVIAQKSPTNFKVIGLALLPVIAIAIYFAYPKIAEKFSNKLHVQLSCEKFDGTVDFSVNTDRNEVVAIRKLFEHKGLVLSDIVKLDDCVIVDSKNWACGGTPSTYGRFSAKDSSIDGKYSYENYGQATMWDSCTFKQLN